MKRCDLRALTLAAFALLLAGLSFDAYSATKTKSKNKSKTKHALKATPTPTPTPTPEDEDDGPTPTPAPTAVPSPYVDQWTSVLDIGFNFPPVVEQSYQAASLNYGTKKKATPLPTFGLEMLYRATDYTRFSFGFGAGKISIPDEPSNFYLRVSVRPDIVVDIKGLPSFYFGPIVGLYFVRQSAETGSVPSGETYSIPAQTRLAIGIGGQIGSDFTLGTGTRLGAYFRYVIVDGAEFEGERVTPSTFPLRAPYKVQFVTIGSRFLFDL